MNNNNKAGVSKRFTGSVSAEIHRPQCKLDLFPFI